MRVLKLCAVHLDHRARITEEHLGCRFNEVCIACARSARETKSSPPAVPASSVPLGILGTDRLPPVRLRPVRQPSVVALFQTLAIRYFEDWDPTVTPHPFCAPPIGSFLELLIPLEGTLVQPTLSVLEREVDNGKSARFEITLCRRNPLKAQAIRRLRASATSHGR